MAQYLIQDGPPVPEIASAWLHASTPRWRTPLEFTIQGRQVVFNWVNELTWVDPSQQYLDFTAKIFGHTYRISYDGGSRHGELIRLGDKTPDLFELLDEKQAAVVRRVSRSL